MTDLKPKIYSAANKKYEEVVILVPFFGGEKIQLKRHLDLFNEIGYDVTIVNLTKPALSRDFQFISSRGKYGMKEVWTEQVEAAMNWIPQKKILFGFSNPSSCAIEAVARRHAVGVSAIVCDSGPTTRLWASLYHYYQYNEPISFLPLRLLATTLTTHMWNVSGDNDLSEALKSLPENFPIFSIRGWKDNLIPPQDIDRHFEPHKHLDWRKLSLPDAGHLNGLRDFESEYVGPLTKFLAEVSSPLQGHSKTV